ncbi:MAG: hypothetical protein IT448_07455 [Phycisphaerales bacterium]|nr:hypothetical protein [Phycisphaerales bacterium]
MASEMDFPTRGNVIKVTDEKVIFAPEGTTYELHLRTPERRYEGPIGVPVNVLIRTTARKLYTVSCGGAFIKPIMGRPRIFQGRVRHVDPHYVVLQAGAIVLVRFPEEESGVDLNNGAIRVGTMVNALLMEGSTLELMQTPVRA